MSEWEITREEINKKVDEVIRKTNEEIEKALLSQFKKLGIEVNKLEKGDLRKAIHVIEDVDRYYYKDILILEVFKYFDDEKFQIVSELRIPT